jgi:hypothetical protein
LKGERYSVSNNCADFLKQVTVRDDFVKKADAYEAQKDKPQILLTGDDGPASIGDPSENFEVKEISVKGSARDLGELPKSNPAGSQRRTMP